MFSINCLADDGGASTGGGHEIESIFREKSIQVATETLNFSDQAKKVLAFDKKIYICCSAQVDNTGCLYDKSVSDVNGFDK